MSGASAAKTMRMVAEVRAARKGENVDEKGAQAQEDKITALFTRQERGRARKLNPNSFAVARA